MSILTVKIQSALTLGLVSLVGLSGLATRPAVAASLVNDLTIAGDAIDKSTVPAGQTAGANTNRLGGFFSDLYYDRSNNVYYGLADRGPGGGTISYDTRVQKFTLDVNAVTGAISNFNLLDTIQFKTSTGAAYNGLTPDRLPDPGASKSNLGRSLDPEGFVLAPNGNFYVSDEYGPSVLEFSPSGQFIRAFTTPANILPKQSNGTLNYTDGRTTITTGRQDNRGFEGLTISPDGKTLYGMLQDPLVNEGSGNDGRNSRNVRIVAFDTTTGASTKQVIYQLQTSTDPNVRQGRNLGISSLTAINDHEFLVMERDNQAIGVDNPTGTNSAAATKQVFKIDITGATDVSNISLAGTDTLPNTVTPVTKSATPFLDIAAALRTAGKPLPEKFEGLTIGPKLSDGSYALIIGTDNDFSVTQNSSNVQFDVCSGGTSVALNTPCPTGQKLIPTYLYSFKTAAGELANYAAPAAVPTPFLLPGLALLGSRLRKRRQVTAS
jgi:hypothetical protein